LKNNEQDMKFTLRLPIFRLAIAGFALAAFTVISARAEDDLVATAKAFVQQAAAHADQWNGPTTGPKAQTGKTVICVNSDSRNGGVKGVADGVTEAAKTIGWNSRIIDGRGEVEGRSQAFGQAIALKPAGIVINGFDAKEIQTLVDQANELGIAVVGWHSATVAGPIEKPKVFFNVTTPAEETAKAAAYLVIASSEGKAGVVIFTDSAFTIALAKSNAMADVIKQCKTCQLLETRIQSLGSATKDMPQVTASLLQKYGKKWTCSLAINDLYFDGMVPALTAADIKPSGQLFNISAGDGSTSAYQRIRSNQYQFATIPEPLNEQGWQLVDELNRAFAGDKPSGYTNTVHIVTHENIEFDGGKKSLFDPDNGYRDQYKKIWGK
jgi:ribose transport system substrate-binding protein